MIILKGASLANIALNLILGFINLIDPKSSFQMFWNKSIFMTEELELLSYFIGMSRIFQCFLLYDVFERMTYNGVLCAGISNLVLCAQLLILSIFYPAIINFSLLLCVMMTISLASFYLYAAWINPVMPAIHAYEKEHTGQHILVVFDSFLQFLLGILFMFVPHFMLNKIISDPVVEYTGNSRAATLTLAVSLICSGILIAPLVNDMEIGNLRRLGWAHGVYSLTLFIIMATFPSTRTFVMTVAFTANVVHCLYLIRTAHLFPREKRTPIPTE